MKGNLILISCILILMTIGNVSSRRVMPWMCLERCNGTSQSIASDLKQIEKHKHHLSGVAFELFNLGPNSTLVVNSFTNVGPVIASFGLETFGMISSFPYPPQFIDWMRQLFSNPQPFIQSVLQQLESRGLTGVNVDFEPSVGGNHQDAIDYANFMNLFANSLHEEGYLLTMDVATWNPVWDWSLLNSTSVDRIMIMSTYTGNWTIFQKDLNLALQQISLDKLGVGLQSINPNTNEPFSWVEMNERFEMIISNDVYEIDIWDTPIPENPVNWWPLIKQFVDQ